MAYLFYRFEPKDSDPDNFSLSKTNSYNYRLWFPSRTSFVPPDLSLKPFIVWWLMHNLNLFANQDYSIFVIYSRNQLIHRSCVFPRYFRFPFMNKDDLQIGDTWTHPEHRGQGLATFALRQVIQERQMTGRKFWYIVEQENKPSIRVVEKAGFNLIGKGMKRKRFGLGLLGSYMIQD